MPDYDFEVVTPSPPQGEECCDFCSSRPVAMAYPCRPHRSGQLLAMDGPGPDMKIDFNSPDGWAACAACHALIQSGMRDQLAWRSVKKLKLTATLSKAEAMRVIRGVHDNFWANRDGAPMTPDEYRRKYGLSSEGR